MAFAVKRASHVLLEPDRMLPHVLPQDFTLDGRAGYRNPKGILGSRLEANVHIVTFSRGTSCAVAWALKNPERVRSLAIGDYVPEEKVLPPGASDRLLGGRIER